MDMTEKLTGVVRTVKASLKADESSTEKKSVYLKLDYSDCTVADLLTKASAHDRIAWQNSSQGRAKFASLVDGSTIEVKASSPGAAPIQDPVEAMIARAAAAGMSVEDYVRAEVAKRIAPKLEPLK